MILLYDLTPSMDVGDGAFNLVTHGTMPPLVVGILGGGIGKFS